MKSNYSLFREGIRPAWEDSANENGGKWVFTVSNKDLPSLDDKWMNLVLSLIGETIDDGDCVTGIVVSLRKVGSKIAIWTRDMDEDRQRRIG